MASEGRCQQRGWSHEGWNVCVLWTWQLVSLAKAVSAERWVQKTDGEWVGALAWL